MSFSFGAPKSDAGAGDAKPDAAQKPFSQVSFNLGFGTTPAVTAANSTGLNLSTTTQSMTPSSFNLGATSNTSAGGFSFGGTAPAAGSAFKLGGATTATVTTSTITSAAPGFSLLGTAKTATLTTPSSSAPTFAFNLGATSAPTTVTSTTGFSLGGTVTSAPLSFGATTSKTTTTATVTPTISLGGALKTTAATGFSISTPTSTVAPLKTTSAIPATGNINFGQLVDAINKWTIDLEEQGKLFSNQAKQLNAWDRLLVSNGEKVLSLNSGIERVKQQQQQLDQELDFVVAQQKELEDLITPLEKELNDIPLTDVDRLHTYQLAENMDTQLKQMSEDLKEIIEQLNESNKSQESSNPISQIRKILNAHMDSLQWIDRHTSKITGNLDQISKIHDLHRKSHEHSLKKTYD